MDRGWDASEHLLVEAIALLQRATAISRKSAHPSATGGPRRQRQNGAVTLQAGVFGRKRLAAQCFRRRAAVKKRSTAC